MSKDNINDYTISISEDGDNINYNTIVRLANGDNINDNLVATSGDGDNIKDNTIATSGDGDNINNSTIGILGDGNNIINYITGTSGDGDNINDSTIIASGDGDNFTDNTIGTSGDGVYEATVGNPSEFVVNASECQTHVTCGLYVAFDGPEKPDIQFDHLEDGNIVVRYLPTVAGLYTLTLKYNDIHVRGSPFKIDIADHGSTHIKEIVMKRNIVRKVKMSGPGMQEGRVNEINEIYLDISHAEINLERELTVYIYGPMKPIYSVEEKQKGIITLAYTPTEKGDYRFVIRFHCEDVPGSPFIVSVN